MAAAVAVSAAAAAPADPTPADPPRPDPETDVTELPVAALRELAEAGDAEAQTELGLRYEAGREVAQDYAVAASWLRRAAEQGYAASGQAPLG